MLEGRILRARKFRHLVFKYETAEQTYFCKVTRDRQDAIDEINGYDLISSHYNVPKRHAVRSDERGRFIITYDYWPSVDTDKGLFLDLINESIFTSLDSLDDFLSELTEHYYSVISRTIAWRHKRQVRTVLYEDRIRVGGRIDNYYGEFDKHPLSNGVEKIHVSNLKECEFIINHRSYRFDWQSCIDDLRGFFINSDHCWSAITQGDPTEINIGYPLVWFDYGAAGYNSVLGEFANFCWDTYVFGGYLVPTYSARMLRDHPNTFNLLVLNKPIITRFEIDRRSKRIVMNYTLKLLDSRKLILEKYFKNTMDPIISKWIKSGWLLDFKRYLSLRILGVYNISSMSLHDTLFCLAKLIEAQSSIINFDDLFLQ